MKSFRPNYWTSLCLVAMGLVLLSPVSLQAQVGDTFTQAVEFQEEGDLEEAADLYEEVAQEDPEYRDVWFQLGELRRQLEQPEAALEAYQNAYDRSPEDPEVLFRLAEMLRSNDQSDTAVQRYQDLLEVVPGHEGALYRLARINDQAGNSESALEYYREFIDRNPGDFSYVPVARAYREVAEFLYDQGNYEEVLEVLEPVKGIGLGEEAKDNFDSLRTRAKQAIERQKRQKRKEKLEAHLEETRQVIEDENDSAALELLRTEADQFGDLSGYQDMEQRLQNRIQFRQWQKQAATADESLSADQLDQLIKQGEQFSNLEEFEQKVQALLGNLYSLRGLQALEQGQASEARTWFQQAEQRERAPNLDRLHAMARLAYQDGNYREAQEYLIQIRTADPGYTINSTLSWMVFFRTTLTDWIWWLGTVAVITGLLFLPIYLLGTGYTKRWTTDRGQQLGTYLLSQEWPGVAVTTYNWLCRVEDMEQQHLMNWIQALRATDHEEKLGEVLEQAHEQGLLPADGVVDFAWYKRDHEGDEAARPLLEDALDHWDDLNESRRARLAQVLSEILFEEGEKEQAFEVLLKLQDDQEPDSDLVQQLVRMSAELGRWDEWHQLGKDWLEEIKSGYIQADYQIGYSDEEQEGGLEDPGSVSKFLHDLYKDHREVPPEEEEVERLEFVLQLVETYQQQRDEVRRLLEHLVQKSLPDDKLREYGRRLAGLMDQDGEVQQATGLLEQLHQRFSNDNDLKEELAQKYLDLDRRNEAFSLFSDLLTGQSDHVTARQGIQGLGQRYESDDDYETAEELYRFILNNSHVKKPDTLFRLAMSLYQQDKVEEALNQLQQINQGGEEFQAQVRSFILRCLVNLEMYDTAVSRLNEIEIENSALDVDLRQNLRYWAGRAHEGMGNQEQAIDHYQSIVAQNMDYADVKARIERLKEQESQTEEG